MSSKRTAGKLILHSAVISSCRQCQEFIFLGTETELQNQNDLAIKGSKSTQFYIYKAVS